MAKTILNFHFDYLNPSLAVNLVQKYWWMLQSRTNGLACRAGQWTIVRGGGKSENNRGNRGERRQIVVGVDIIAENFHKKYQTGF